MVMAMAFLTALAVTVLLGRPVIARLRRMKAGQKIKEDGPAWHMSKQGTPTMGGVMFIVGVLAAMAVLELTPLRTGARGHLAVLLFALVYGAIGMVDDSVKLRKKQNGGLSASQKFLLQLAAAIAFIALLRYFGYLSPDLYLPFFTRRLVLSWPAYMALSAFIIVGTVNAVNLTDGVDGLASCVTLPVAVFFVIMGAVMGKPALGGYAAAIAGGLCGFLCYNFHPARVFMGDTGSLFLGGSVAGLAFAFDMPLILVFVGIIYIAEAMSDIIQVAYFKATHGKRVFRMAPLHHHLEMGGWSEKRICFVFAAITVFFCFIAIFGMERYAV